MAGVPPLWGPLAGLAAAAYPALQQYGPMAYGFYKKIRSRNKNLTMTIGKGTGFRRTQNQGPRSQAERKHADSAWADNFYTVATNAALNNISVIPHGFGVHERNGRKIRITGVLIRGTIIAGTTQTIPHNCGFQLTLDHKPRGSLPASADILETDNTPYRLPQGKQGGVRFKTLMRKVWTVVGDGDTLTGAAPMYHINEYRKLNVVTTFDDTDTTGVIATCDENALYLIQLGEGADTTASPRFDLNIRVCYRDIE